MISSMPQMQSEGRNFTIGIAQMGQNLCFLLLRRSVHCVIGQVVFGSSAQRLHIVCRIMALHYFVVHMVSTESVDCIATVASTCDTC